MYGRGLFIPYFGDKWKTPAVNFNLHCPHAERNSNVRNAITGGTALVPPMIVGEEKECNYFNNIIL